ncbi:MAG: sigma-70 family RNA polymerase sigma factor [Acidobacteriota bacterium]
MASQAPSGTADRGLSDPSRISDSVDHLFRHRAGEMVAVLGSIFGFRHLDLVEDMVQEALLRTLRLWPYQGLPKNPSAWIVQVAKNRALEVLRQRGRRYEEGPRIEALLDRLADSEKRTEAAFKRELRDDQLRMIFACCHPSLKRNAQVALTLKTVGGFSVAEIGRAFLNRPATIAQRLVRAKAHLRQEKVELTMPQPDDLGVRLEAVHETFYLMFNEGWDAAEGEDLVRQDLVDEAIRLTGLLADHPLSGTPATHALAALVRFQAARLATRVNAQGDLMLLPDQDRSRWDRRRVAEALGHLLRAARGDRLTTYHYQAEIAACDATAPSYEDTDWQHILHCYDGLLRLRPSPVVALNRLVALAESAGPGTALAQAAAVVQDPTLEGYFPAWAIHGDLLDRCGRPRDAARAFERALALTASQPIRRNLERRLAALR